MQAAKIIRVSIGPAIRLLLEGYWLQPYDVRDFHIRFKMSTGVASQPLNKLHVACFLKMFLAGCIMPDQE
jgi:hypothetical protein